MLGALSQKQQPGKSRSGVGGGAGIGLDSSLLLWHAPCHLAADGTGLPAMQGIGRQHYRRALAQACHSTNSPATAHTVARPDALLTLCCQHTRFRRPRPEPQGIRAFTHTTLQPRLFSAHHTVLSAYQAMQAPHPRSPKIFKPQPLQLLGNKWCFAPVLGRPAGHSHVKHFKLIFSCGVQALTRRRRRR